jgi:hypothetical protein
VKPTVDAERLAIALRRAWDAETSNDPVAWSPSNPALGQCAVTALVVQDYFGGELLRAEVAGVSHYWNQLGDRTVDLTREQFAEFNPSPPDRRTRQYVLSNEDSQRRYRRLAAKVRHILEEADDGGRSASLLIEHP